MQNDKATILAINPGSKYIGIAVLDGSDLIDWGVKVIDNRSPARLQRSLTLVARLIAEHQPDIIAVKKLHPSRSSAALDSLCHSLVLLAENSGLRLCRYSIDELEAFYGLNGTANKQAMAEIICRKYPVLHRVFYRERRTAHPYHIRMFEAVALACACLNDCRGR